MEHGDCARENQQVRPGDLATLLLLDQLEESMRFVQICLIGPDPERREALLAAARTTPAVEA